MLYDQDREPRVVVQYRTNPLVPFLLLVAVGLLAWQVFGPFLRRLTDPNAQPRAVTARGELAPIEQSVIALYKSASPSVVHVTNVALRRDRFTLDVLSIPQGTGTGFVWDPRGYVVTNAHVVAGGQQFRVTLADDTNAQADLVGADASNDIAVLRLRGVAEGKLSALAVGTSDDLEVGQSVFAIGNPFGLDQTLTTGVISGLARQIQAANGQVISGVIQTDAAINPGNSGGPLLDSAGRLIGMNTAIISTSKSSAGIGFAIPVSTINHVVPRLIRGEKPQRAGIGVTLAPDQETERRKIKGALILGVIRGGAAEQAGLQGMRDDPESGELLLGDVITAVDDRAVGSGKELQAALSTRAVGDRVRLGVLRGGKTLTLDVTLQPVPGN
jgi:S1-C subfamily serine protease